MKPLYIDKLPPIQWIENVLDGKSELDLVIHRNEQFLIKVDWKMNTLDIETLHLLVFPLDRQLKTVRDLTKEHIPMLKAIKEQGYHMI